MLRRGLLAFFIALLTAGGLVVPSARAADVPVSPGAAFALEAPGNGAATFTFTGAAGRRATLTTLSGAPGAVATLGLSSAATGPVLHSFYEPFSEIGVLPVAGVWTLTVTNFSSAAISATARLDLVADVSRPLTLGAAGTQTFTPGQNAELSFTATAGQKIALTVSSFGLTSSRTPGLAALLRRPDGSLFQALGPQIGGPAQQRAVLDVSGTWTLVLDAAYDSAGSIGFTLSALTDQLIDVRSGRAVAVHFPGTGAGVRLRFAARTGQRVTLGVTASSLTSAAGLTDQPQVNASLGFPDGTSTLLLGESGQFRESPWVLEADGTYSVVLDPVLDTAGTQTVVAGIVDDATRAVTPSSTPTVFRVAVPGQNGVLTFPATAGQNLVATLDSASLTAGSAGGDPGVTGLTARLYTPGGGLQTTLFDADRSFAEFQVPESGDWKIVIDPAGDSVGRVKVTVRPQGVTTLALNLGARTTTPRIRPGDLARYTFTGVPGRRVAVDITKVALTGGGAYLRVVRPDGSTFSSSNGFDQPQFFETAGPLDVAGTWTLEFDPGDAAAGRLTFTAQQPVDVTGSITTGRAAIARLRVPGQQARYTFQGVAGRYPVIDSTLAGTRWASAAGESSTAQFFLFRPDGSQYGSFDPAQPFPNPDSTSTRAQLPQFTAGSLDVTGTWTLVVDPDQNAVGSQTFTLKQLTTPTQGRNE